MADLQTQFRTFHDAIAIKPSQEKKLLASKRKIILDKLSESIKKRRKGGEEIPSYKHRNQGSYAMNTGNKPVTGEDYDLDVALLFDLAKKDFDPLTVKEWVYTALKEHTSDVQWREPCVTVFYSQKGEYVYHVDFAIYSAGNDDNNCYLARGKEHSGNDHWQWEEADPEALIETMKNHLADAEDAGQFRRVIRYLKRWKDVNFSSDGNESPTGIALTACALKWFAVMKHEDRIANKTTYDDFAATLALVREMLAKFKIVPNFSRLEFPKRLKVALPVPPGNDLFEKMTNKQMDTFRERLEKLRDHLVIAQDDIDPHTAAKKLADVFGDDFPVPAKEDTAKSRDRAITSSGNSA